MVAVSVAKVYGIDLREESNIVSMACPAKLLRKVLGRECAELQRRPQDGLQ
jgi:hypothetical protein